MSEQLQCQALVPILDEQGHPRVHEYDGMMMTSQCHARPIGVNDVTSGQGRLACEAHFHQSTCGYNYTLPLPTPVALYTDGGCILKNPSEHGCTWAWRQVGPDDMVLRQQGGLLLADAFPANDQPGKWENNLAELVALLRGLRALPEGWSGTVYCDNKNALGWVFEGYKMKTLPQMLVNYVPRAKARLGEVKTVLLAGHPSNRDLERGYLIKSEDKKPEPTKWPVSRHNRWCDQHCGQWSSMYQATVVAPTVRGPEFTIHASGKTECAHCLLPYDVHPTLNGIPTLHLRCDGTPVKL